MTKRLYSQLGTSIMMIVQPAIKVRQLSKPPFAPTHTFDRSFRNTHPLNPRLTKAELQQTLSKTASCLQGVSFRFHGT